jgi:hypothetical protein
MTRPAKVMALPRQAFVDDQLRASDEGTFFAGYNFITCIGRRLWHGNRPIEKGRP